jgi:rhamnogalacturonan endolyase
MLRCLLLLSAILVALRPIHAQNAAPLPISNADFEAAKPLDSWSFWSRTNEGAAEISSEARTGQNAARLRHSGPRDWAFSNATKFDVKPGQQFMVSAWMRGSGTIQLAVVALSKGQTLSWDIGGDANKAFPQWLRLEGEVNVPPECDQIYVRFVGTGKCDVRVDDVALVPGGRPRVTKPKVEGFAKTRVREPLGRGLVALALPNNRVFLSWRLLDDDAKNIAFNVYRRAGGKTDKLNATPISQTCDFTDAAPPAGENKYFVRAIFGNKEAVPSDEIAVTPSAEGQPYVSIKLDGPYKFQKIAFADLDGDARLDYVIKTPEGNVDPYEKYWVRSPETNKIEAYRHDGKLLWRHDMGWAVERGIWYSPYIVFDFDGDGRAEVAVKSGEGDPRDADGKVTSGAEYLSILDGRTGREITRAAWPSRDGFPDYNFYSRNQLGVAFLDGKTPCLIVERGTYNTIKIVAYELRGGKLRELWNWNDREDGGAFRGQGAHCLRAADIDGDGRDEIIYGSAVLDDNGSGLWSTRMGHPDHVTVGDLDPLRPGLEIQYGLEIAQRKNGICMVDARTGQILWGLAEPTIHIHSSGLCADLDASHPGVESYGGERDAKDKRWLFAASGKLIATRDFGDLAPRAAYWDADPQRELLAGGKLRDFDANLAPLEMTAHEPKIEGSVVGIADILGDWREEIIASLPGELRIYSTTIPAADRRVCLLRDAIYRNDVIGLSQGYWQVPGITILPSAEK